MTTESLSPLPPSLSSAFRGGPFGDYIKGWDHCFSLPLKRLHFCFSDTFFLMPPDTQTLCSLNSQGIFESEFLCLDAMKGVHSYPEARGKSLHCIISGAAAGRLSACGSCMM